MKSLELKRKWLKMALLEGDQSVKLILATARVGTAEESGIPQDIYRVFEEGIPLDLRPSMPLDIDFDTDADAMLMDLSFAASVRRCRIPWSAIVMMAIGIGGVSFEHEDDVPEPEVSRIIKPRGSGKLSLV